MFPRHIEAGKRPHLHNVSFALVRAGAPPVTLQLKCIKMLIWIVLISLFPDSGTCSFHPSAAHRNEMVINFSIIALMKSNWKVKSVNWTTGCQRRDPTEVIRIPTNYTDSDPPFSLLQRGQIDSTVSSLLVTRAWGSANNVVLINDDIVTSAPAWCGRPLA